MLYLIIENFERLPTSVSQPSPDRSSPSNVTPAELESVAPECNVFLLQNKSTLEFLAEGCDKVGLGLGKSAGKSREALPLSLRRLFLAPKCPTAVAYRWGQQQVLATMHSSSPSTQHRLQPRSLGLPRSPKQSWMVRVPYHRRRRLRCRSLRASTVPNRLSSTKI